MSHVYFSLVSEYSYISVRIQLHQLQITYSYFSLQLCNITLCWKYKLTKAMQVTTDNIP